MAREWIKLGKVDDYNFEKLYPLEVKGKSLILLRTETEFLVAEGICPHQGAPLCEGTLEGQVVTCPAHNWRFDLKTGESPVVPDAFIYTYNTKIDNDWVYLRI